MKGPALPVEKKLKKNILKNFKKKFPFFFSLQHLPATHEYSQKNSAQSV